MPDKMEDFVKVVIEKLECKNPIIICGFPGMGLVGNIVSQFLMDQFNMTNCGYVESRLFPPVAIVYGGLVKNPVRIYENAEQEIMIVFSDIPIDPVISGEVGRSIIKWADTVKPKEVITIAGLATTGEEHRVFAAGATQDDLVKFKDDALLFEVGTISGVPGVIMNECRNHYIPAVCILGETRGANPDPRSSAELVKVLAKVYGWKINVDILIKEADQIEQMMHKLSEQVGEAEAKPSKDYSMYG
ncbi:MAG TPA: proteasome assembly chaperone family protein [Methanocella sp.]|uniref:proteasome assembly chaperone family protein n=1 Tax=Methanocella sp. TaxID=2052833 RepID=UPI002C53A310|nr:proteasome assembly chaperone family protein [Methanocella sp.]HTY90057.1 proteasome assembly chaperone family protein [Methanocella sp.]